MNKSNRPKNPSPTDGMIVCPYCGCEIWHVGSVWYRCFLCRRTFGGKVILGMQNITRANQELRKVKKANEDFESFFNEWFEKEVE